MNLDAGAAMLIPVPSPYNGLIVVGTTTISYINGTGSVHSVEIQPTQMCAYSKIDAQGTRYLLGDYRGLLLVLVLNLENYKVSNVMIDHLGTTSIPNSINYLDNGVVFVGSLYGDSQLIKLLPQKDAFGSNIEILQSYTNIGPVVDMCLVESRKQLVTCSGLFKDGSLRVVRSGIGIVEQVC